MFQRPRLRHGLLAVPITGQGTILLAEDESKVLDDARLEKLLPLLDGQNLVRDIQAAMLPDTSPVETSILIGQLARKGYVYEAPGEDVIDPEYWTALGQNPASAIAALEKWRVKVTTCGRVTETVVADILGEYARVCEGKQVFEIVLTDHYLRPELEERNRKALAEGQPWMLVKATGRELWIGPIFVPGETGCWQCLAQRLRLNRQVETFVREGGYAGEELYAMGGGKPSALGLSLAGNALLKWLATGKSEALGAVLTHHVARVQQQRHVLVRRPQCPACGDAGLYARTAGREVNFQSMPKDSKPFAAELAYQKLSHHISPVTGIVKEIVPLRLPQAPFLQIQIGVHSQCDRYENLEWLRESMYTFSFGKGRREAEARMSALAESIEVHLTTRLGDEPVIIATRAELSDRAIAPESMTLFSERQQEAGEQRGAWPDTDRVPARIEATQPISWVPVWSLTEGRQKFAPADCLYWDVDEEKALAGYGTTDGSAASWSRETAFLHAFFEVLERDAASMWWYNRLRRPAVDLAAFDDPFLHDMMQQYARMGRRLWVLDLTNDFQVPAFVALSAEAEAPHAKPMYGCGCHLDARIALYKAVTELNQFLPHIFRFPENPPPRPGEGKTNIRVANEWFSTVNLENQPWLAPSNEPLRGPGDFPQAGTTDYREDIRLCLDRARERGIEVLMLERTRPDIDLHVVKVIAPGLRHFWPRFAPGRLYDVPVAMGWLEKAQTEDEMNPIPVFV